MMNDFVFTTNVINKKLKEIQSLFFGENEALAFFFKLIITSLINF